jgi:hypothetical protein
MDTRLINLSVHSDMPTLRKAAKVCKIPKPEIGDFIGDTCLRAIEAGKGGPDKFGAFFSSRAIGWKAHGKSRSSADKIERRALRDTIADSEGNSISALGSLPWMVDPERVCIALESLAMVDRLPAKYRDALVAHMQGKSDLPGVSPALFRKRVQLAREYLGGALEDAVTADPEPDRPARVPPASRIHGPHGKTSPGSVGSRNQRSKVQFQVAPAGNLRRDRIDS